MSEDEKSPLEQRIEKWRLDALAELDRQFGNPTELLLDEKPKKAASKRRRADYHGLRVIEGGKK